MSHSTAQNRLRKLLLYSMAVDLDRANCFHCGEFIDDIKEFSIEHKIPWLDSENPVKLFFDIKNISFSHLSCNIKAQKKWNKGIITIPNHGTLARYKDKRFKCRCRLCRNANKEWLREYRKRRNGE